MPIATDPVWGSVTIDGESYPVVIGGSDRGGSSSRKKVGLTHKADINNTSAQLEVTVLAGSRAPPEDVDISASIQGQTIFTGTVSSSESRAGDRAHVVAHDAADDLKQESLTQSFDRATLGMIAQATLDTAGVSGSVDLPNEMTSHDFNEMRCDKVLSRCAKWGDGVWYVSRSNQIQVTENIEEISVHHDLEHVKDASAGVKRQRYESVKVVGASPASRKGQESMHMLASQPVIATAGSGDPRYTHRDEGIRTQKMADKAATSILKKLKRKTKGGWIKIIGDPSILPFDTVALPESQGGEEYLAASVKHRISKKNGFTTEIGVAEAEL